MPYTKGNMRIALCMIVRDEEAMLPGCLASVQSVVDEIVVVDTGSSDRTIEIARTAGAKVVELPWQDDFSAPRNCSIEQTDADWILMLDADERLTAGARSKLRAVAESADFDCGMLPLHNAKHLDSNMEAVVRGEERLMEASYLPRLLRHVDNLRYTGIIHESVGQWLLRGHNAKLIEGVDIVHFGGVPDVRAQKAKAERNIQMLERYRAQQPDDITPYGYLAQEYLEIGESDKAYEVAKAGWSLLEARPQRHEERLSDLLHDWAQQGCDLSALRLAVTRGWIEVQRRDPSLAIASVERGLAVMVGHPDLIFISGCAHEKRALSTSDATERRAELELALARFLEARAQHSKAFVQKFVDGCTGWATFTRAATIRLLLGEPREALRAFDKSIELGEDASFEARWGRIECMLALGNVAEAVKAVRDVLNERPNGWVLAALAAEAVGNIKTMTELMAKAQALLSNGFITPHRVERYADALAALSMYTARPGEVPGPMGQLALLMQRRFEPVAGALVRPRDKAMTRRILQHLLVNDHQQLVEPLADPQAEALAPGIAADIEAALDSLNG